MSTFYQWFSNIHFTSQCLFFQRTANFTISFYYKKNIGSPFFVKFPFQKPVCRMVFNHESVPKKNSQNSKKAIYAGVSFPMKSKVAGRKEALVLVRSCEFCKFFKKDYVAVHVRTAACDIFRYP